jgi:hypothetical protein
VEEHVEVLEVLVVEQYLLVQQDQQLLEDQVILLLIALLKVIQVELTLKLTLILVDFQDQVVVELEALDQQLLLVVPFLLVELEVVEHQIVF